MPGLYEGLYEGLHAVFGRAPGGYGDALRICALLAVVARAARTDLRSGKIGNRLTAAAAVCGLVAGAAGGRLAPAVAGLLLPFVAMFPLFAMRALGAGDIKLLMAAGCIMGFRFSAYLLASSLLAGGVIALALALANRRLASGMANLWRYVRACFALRALLPYGEMPAPADSAGRAAAAAKYGAPATEETPSAGAAAPKGTADGDAAAPMGTASGDAAAPEAGPCNAIDAPEDAPIAGAAAPEGTAGDSAAAPMGTAGGNAPGPCNGAAPGRAMKFSLAILAGTVASLLLLYAAPWLGAGLR
jgi:prepilin peptidase CpaA